MTTLMCAGVGSRMLCLTDPMYPVMDMTSSSLIGSIGGLVTWANICLKKLKSDCGRSENIARGASNPVDPIGSLPAETMGSITLPMSSAL